MTRTKKRDCFVIMPYGVRSGTVDRSDEGDAAPSERASDATEAGLWQLLLDGRYEIDFDRLYEEVIVPATRRIPGYRIRSVRCDELAATGQIHKKMIEQIADADIAIVELTTLNPNVFYELGVRHALNRAITVMIQHEGLDERIPFNIGGLSVVTYDLNHPEEAVRRIREALSASLEHRNHQDSLVFGMLPELQVAVRRPRPLTRTVTRHHRLGREDRCVGVVTGDISNVRGVDVWVSSENTEMEMARFTEQAISASIRYHGSVRDASGGVTDDVIQQELRRILGERNSVPAGHVVVTHAGELTRTNDVKWIFHTASVTGQVGRGYTTIDGIGACVTNALKRAESRDFVDPSDPGRAGPVRSILLPILGSGQAGRRAEDAFANLLENVIAHFQRFPQSTIREVLFLAFTDEQQKVCREVMETWDSDELSKEQDCPADTAPTDETPAPNERP